MQTRLPPNRARSLLIPWVAAGVVGLSDRSGHGVHTKLNRIIPFCVAGIPIALFPEPPVLRDLKRPFLSILDVVIF